LYTIDSTTGNPVVVSGISSVDSLTNINGVLYLQANSGTSGTELWKIDPTTGTPSVIDIVSGTGSSSPANLTDVNGTLFFTASNLANGQELWKLDSTGNPVLVKDIRSGSSSSSPSNLFTVNGTLYFTANDGTNGVELWKSDGTTAGTVQLEIYPGANSSNVANLINVDGTLYFTANNATNGTELWRINATTGNPEILEIQSGNASSSPTYLTNVNGTLYFQAYDSTNSYELWKVGANGTPTRIDLGSGSSSPNYLTNVNGTLYFTATGYNGAIYVGNELWKVDPTTGMPNVIDIVAGSGSSYPSNLINANGVLYFVASNSVNGYELWKIDPTTGSPIFLKDIYAGSSSSNPGNLTYSNGKLYFTAGNYTQGVELWQTNGTTEGTVLIQDINQTTYASNPSNFIKVGDVLYFTANDDVNGTELWKADPTTGAVSLIEVNPGSGSSNINYLTDVNGMLYFQGYDNTNGYELWKVGANGTPTRIDLGSGGSSPAYLTNINGTLYFTATGYNGTTYVGNKIWKIDATTGTPNVIDVTSGSSYSSPYGLINANGVLYFVGSSPGNGYELWKVDPTTGTPVFLKDIYAGSKNSSPGNLTYSNGKLYFTADNGIQGVELWAVDVDVITTVGNVTKTSDEEQTVTFAATDFIGVFNSGSGLPLATVKILLLPSNGILKLGNNVVTANQEIAVASLGNLTYIPNTNFNGTAGFTWNGSDGTTYAPNPSTVILTINSINDVPIIVNPIADVNIYSNRTFNFGFAANTFQDVDLGDTLIYSASLADGSPLPRWLALSGDRDFAANPAIANAGQYEIKVTAKDQSNAAVADNFILNVVNSAPTYIFFSNNTIPENSANDTPIAILSSQDNNSNDTHAYTLVNDAGGRFTIDGNQLVVANTSLLDYEAATQHTIRVKTTDSSGLSYEQNTIIYISNVNDSFAGTLSFTSSAFSINENGNAVAAVTVQRTGGSEGTVSANITLTNGTAIYPNDYGTTFVNVVFANGETSKTVIIPVFDDNAYEGNETLNLTLVNPTGGANLGTQTTAVLTVIDNDNVPDLIVSNITAPVEVISGQQLEISWTDKNQGVTAATGTWYDYVYLQNQNNGQNYDIGIFEFTGTLAVGSSIDRTQTVNIPIQIQGNYRVIVSTDYYGNILEGIQNKSNNIATDDRPIQVKLAPIPNLQVTSVIAPPNAFSSQSTSIQWMVKNVGNGATSSPNWSDVVYLSLDSIYDSTDIHLGTAINPSYLNAGDSYVNSLNVALPRGLNGNYYFLVKTDINNNVFENDKEGDNFGAANSTNISLTPPPDFQVTSVTTPSQGFSGQPLSISWTISNNGPGKNPETNWYDQVFLSDDETLDAGDRNLGSFYRSGTLNSNDSYTASQTINLPIGISGDYFFFVRTDAGNQVYENVFEGNNEGRKATSTRINLTPPPDLEIDDINAPSQATSGRPLTFSYQVTNYGATATPNTSWTDTFYLSHDNQLDINVDFRFGSQAHYGSLATDGSYTSPATFVLPNTFTGNYYLFAVADSGNEVFELDNNNNTFFKSSPISIISKPADLVVTSATAPSTAEAGKAIRIEWTVKNQGIGDTVNSSWTDRIILSADNQIGNGDDISLGSFSRSGLLNSSGSYTRSELVTLPFQSIGQYQVFVSTDAGNSVYEANYENNNVSTGQALAVTQQNPDLQVTQVSSPTTGQSGQSLTVNWTVQNSGSNRTNANYWYDAVYLSTDSQLSSDDILLGINFRSSVLDPSSQYEVTRSFGLPASLQGNYYTIVRADIYNNVFEGSLENNNDKATEGTTGTTGGSTGGTTVGLTEAPDLVLDSLDVPATGISGQNLSINWTVRNAGTVETGQRSWYEAFYLSRDQVFDRNSDAYIGYSYFSGNLAAGETYNKSASFRVPQGISGPLYLFAVTDSGNSVYERTGENNNVSYDPNSVAITLSQPADLVIGTIAIPTTGAAGRNASITYTVTNQGVNPVQGNWADSLYISKDDQWDIGDAYLGQVQNSGELNNGSSYTKTLAASLPGLVPGDYRIIVRSDIRNQISESNESNNLKATLDQVNIDIERLTVGAPTTGTLGQGQAVYYRFDVGAGETLRLKLDSVSTAAANELYLRYGEVPTRSNFDLGFSETLSPDQEIVIPATRGGTYYVLAYGGNVPTVANYTLEADLLEFSISALGTSKGSNKGQTTVKISGAKFTSDDVVSLIATDGTQHQANKVRWKDSTELWATFDLQGLATGTYDLRVNNSAKTAVLNDSFTVTSGAVGHLETQLDLPSALRPGQAGIATIHYANTGETDLTSPLLTLSAKGGLFYESGEYRDSTIQLLAINPEGAAGIFSPGTTGSFSIRFLAENLSVANVNFTLNSLATDEIIDWNNIKESSRPEGIAADAWDKIYGNFVASIGGKASEFQKVLADNANRLSQLGEYTTDISRLLSFELQQVNSNAISARSAVGAFGRGGVNPWDVSAITDTAGNVAIQTGDRRRIFTKETDGTYQGITDDLGILTKLGEAYQIKEFDGTVQSFLTNGKLDFIQDTNGNKITLGYTNNRLTELSYSNGDNVTFKYNAQGRVNEVVDIYGQSTNYTYDATGERLLSVSDASGTVSYTYETEGAKANAIKSIIYPDGTQSLFEYDDLGRVTKESLNGGEQILKYSYDSTGGVSVTDANNKTSQVLLNDRGQVAQTKDALGRVSRFSYDSKGNLTQVFAPDGSNANFTYDSKGNLLTSSDALGRTVKFAYDSRYDQIAKVKDQNGNAIEYTYDSRGNLDSITYADGSKESFTYGDKGDVTVSSNRREQQINYTYDSRGLLAKKEFADGTSATFEYNLRGNLTKATDADSNVTYNYDAADRLTKVSYGTTRFLSFSYDAGGRRSQMVDQDDFATNYSYDSVGRLKQLTDKDGKNIVSYSYNALGQLTREDNGNGTYTTYAYDDAGQALSIVNYKPDNSINSRSDYTYNQLGQRTSLTTLEGKTSYGYDAIGQLVSVNLPNGRSIEYKYDAAGNRITVKDSGVTTSYSTNNLNQYTTVGGDVYSYDKDGNLTSKTVGGKTSTLSYDIENRLIGVTNPDGTWQYQYDALGNRIGSTLNGQKTEYLLDPTGLGDVVGEYTGSQAIRYSHGLGLVSRNDGSNTSFFDTDAIGSVVGLSGTGGNYLNSYSYLPFGESLTKTETVANSFEYVGQFGVMNEANGLDFMRARFYTPGEGRFISADPIGVNGGVNLYVYTQNSPVRFTDPLGLFTGSFDVAATGGFVIGGTVQVSIVYDGNTPWYNPRFQGTVGKGLYIGAGGSVSFGGTYTNAANAKQLTGKGAQGGGSVEKVGTELVKGKGYKGWDWSVSPLSYNYPGMPAEIHYFDTDTTDLGSPGDLLNFLNPSNPNSPLNPNNPNNPVNPSSPTSPFNPNNPNSPLNPNKPNPPSNPNPPGNPSPPSTRNPVFKPKPEAQGQVPANVVPRDPNDIIGPTGFGEEKWTSASSTLPYTIRFENISTATAPAQTVTVTHPLDTDLDFRTFRLSSFGWGGLIFDVPANTAFYNQRLDLTATRGYFVDVTAGIDIVKGEAFWIVTTIDPNTGDVPVDPLTGFLPPNNTDGIGDGFLNYTIKAKRGVTTGTVIDAKATIIFDTQAPIDTPPIFNTLDAGKPTTSLDPLPATVPDPEFLVSWLGSDDTNGSAIAHYDVYVSDNGGEYLPWLQSTKLTEAPYVGLLGHQYTFYAVATDNAGNIQVTPATAQATTRVAAGPVTDVNEAPTAVVLTNTTASLAENTNTDNRIKVADIAITDDALGSNSISLQGADAAAFEVDGTALFLKAGTSLNYEAKTAYAVTVSVGDTTIGGSSPVSTAYSLAVTDVNEAPTAVALTDTTASLAENTNTSSRIKVADIAISDDALGSNSISLQGVDAVDFELDGTALFLKAGTSLDFETKTAYAVTVSVGDTTISGSSPVSTGYNFAISDVNEAPTAVALTNTIASLAENTNTSSRIKVADIAINDDALGSNSISLQGADAAAFELEGTALFVKAGTSLDFETKTTYAVTVSVGDTTISGSSPVSTAYNFAVSDVNEAPTAVALTNTIASLAENTNTNSRIKLADIAINDDALGSNSISLQGADAAAFELEGTALFVKAGTSLNYETKTTYAVTVSVGDTTISGSSPVSTGYNFAISDVNEAPTAVALTNTIASLAENSNTNSRIKLADIAINDDALGSNSISLLGVDAAAFEVDGTALFLKAGTSLNYEIKTAYSVTVSVSDTTISGSSPVSTGYNFAVSDVNEAPTAVALTNTIASLAENSNTNSRIKLADIAISDDALGSNSISLLGADASAFEVEGTALFLKAGISLNYETKTAYAVTVSVGDTTIGGSSPVSTGYSFAVSDVNEAPTAVALTNTIASLAENTNTSSRIKVADIAISDDALGTNSISLLGTDAAAFELEGTALFLKAGTSLNYETKTAYAVTVSVGDTTIGGSSLVSTGYNFAVSDVNETPTAVALSATAFDENISAGSLIATLNSSDPDTSNSFTYTLVAGSGAADNNSFSISGSNLIINSSPNYEAKSSYSLRLRSTDQGALFTEKEFTFLVNNLIEEISSAASTTLPSDYDNLALTGSSNINGAGNSSDNSLTGNAGQNSLYGLAGNDKLFGRDGDDTLDGGLGDDTMNGGAGNDTFYVNSIGDFCYDAPGQGVDTVISSIGWALDNYIENLTLTGASDINAWGNEWNNLLVGNSGNNVLNGNGGLDTMIGGIGDDKYVVDNIADVVVEDISGGLDWVESSVNWIMGSNLENLILTGGGNLSGTGNALDNRIKGNTGDNILDGGQGRDNLIGDAGADIFKFSNSPGYGATGADRILDFSGSSGDRLLIGKAAFGIANASASLINTNSTDLANALKTNNLFVYNTSNGHLYHNVNGSAGSFGNGGIFAVLTNTAALQADWIGLY
jgi:RHS repeat-associated protein